MLLNSPMHVTVPNKINKLCFCVMQSLVRGGITLSATYNYRLEPAASIQACTASCSLTARMCIGVYDSWPDNTLNFYAWYQSRRVEFCGRGWFVSIVNNEVKVSIYYQLQGPQVRGSVET